MASGGTRAVSWRQCEVAVAAAVKFDRVALAGVNLTRSAISPATMPAFFRAAIDTGMAVINKGSLTAAPHHFTQHDVRAVRAEHNAVFTLDAPGDFTAQAAWPPLAHAPAMLPTLAYTLAYTDALEVSMCVDVDGEGLVLSARANLCWTCSFTDMPLSPLSRAGSLFLP